MSWLKNKKRGVEESLEPLTGKLEPLSAPPRAGNLGTPGAAKPKAAVLGPLPAVSAIPGVEVGEEERGTLPDVRERLVYTASPQVPVPDVMPAPRVEAPMPAQDLISPSGETLELPVDTLPDDEAEEEAARASAQAAQEHARVQAQRQQEAQTLFGRRSSAQAQDVQISLSVQTLPYVDTTRKPGYARESRGGGGVVFTVQAWFPQVGAKASPAAPVFSPSSANIAVQVPAGATPQSVTAPAPQEDTVTAQQVEAVPTAPARPDVVPVPPVDAPPAPSAPEPSAPEPSAPARAEAHIVPLSTGAQDNYILNAESLLGGDDHIQAIERAGPEVDDDEQLRAALAEEARRGIQEASQRAHAQERTPGDTQ